MVDGLYKNQFRVKSARLPDYDYSQNGVYFVTTCTLCRQKYFGEVVSGEMNLNEMGMIIAEEWLKTEIIRNNVRLDEWVVMPDHFHGLLIIENDTLQDKGRNLGRPSNIITGTSLAETEKSDMPVSIIDDFDDTILAMNRQGGGHKPQWKSGSLGAIINQFKMQCTKRIRSDFDQNFSWQARFYDGIIRQKNILDGVRQYIENNPVQWEKNKDNIDGLYR